MQEVAITQEVGPSQDDDNDDIYIDGAYVEDILADRKMSEESCQVHVCSFCEKIMYT